MLRIFNELSNINVIIDTLNSNVLYTNSGLVHYSSEDEFNNVLSNAYVNGEPTNTRDRLVLQTFLFLGKYMVDTFSGSQGVTPTFNSDCTPDFTNEILNQVQNKTLKQKLEFGFNFPYNSDPLYINQFLPASYTPITNDQIPVDPTSVNGQFLYKLALISTGYISCISDTKWKLHYTIAA